MQLGTARLAASPLALGHPAGGAGGSFTVKVDPFPTVRRRLRIHVCSFTAIPFGGGARGA